MVFRNQELFTLNDQFIKEKEELKSQNNSLSRQNVQLKTAYDALHLQSKDLFELNEQLLNEQKLLVSKKNSLSFENRNISEELESEELGKQYLIKLVNISMISNYNAVISWMVFQWNSKFETIAVKGDGNCVYSVILLGIKVNNLNPFNIKTSKALRTDISNYVKDNKPTIIERIGEWYSEDMFNSAVNNIRNSNDYADIVSYLCIIISAAISSNIYVYSIQNKHIVLGTSAYHQLNFTNISILHNGEKADSQIGHYFYLKEQNQTK